MKHLHLCYDITDVNTDDCEMPLWTTDHSQRSETETVSLSAGGWSSLNCQFPRSAVHQQYTLHTQTTSSESTDNCHITACATGSR